MQCNFIFYLFVTSSLFFLEVVVKIFDYFWKSDSLFSKFCVNCLLMFSFVYCNNCALKDVNRACYCTCSLVDLRVPEMCFWPAKSRKSLNFLRCIYVIDLVLKYGSDITEGNWLQLHFYFILLKVTVASVIGLSFFSYVSGFRLKFSRIALWRKRLQLDSKSDLTTNGLILEFFVWIWILSLTSYLFGLKFAGIAQLLFFFDDINFFRCLVWGVFWSVL